MLLKSLFAGAASEEEPLDDVEVVDPNQLKDSNDDESQIKLEL